VTVRGSVRGIAALCLIGATAVFAAQSAQAAPAAHLLPGGASATSATCSPALKAISLSPASLPGGAHSTVTATLSCAPSKAVSVSLKGFTGAKVPSTVKVAAGKTSATGTMTTATRTKALHGWITGALGKVSKRSLLTIGVTPKTCKTTGLSGISLASLAYVGDKPALGIKLTCYPASAVRLALKSTVAGTQAPALTVPATVTINAYYDSASVVLAPKADMSGQYTATVSAHYGSKTLTKTITVDPGLSQFQIPPEGGAPDAVSPDILFTGQVPAGGLTVKLKSSNAAITVPATTSFSPLGLGGGFLGVKVADVAKNTPVTLSATLGSTTLTTSITLLPPWNSHDKITLANADGTATLYGPASGYEIYVNLSDPADPDGSGLTATVTDSSPNDVQLETGSTVDFAPGSDQGFISFEVPNETAPVHATVSVSLDGVTASVPVTIEPSLASVTVPATIVGGQSGTGTVTLAGAPDVAETVDLNSDWGIVTVPASVTIPAGQTSVTFPITTVAVTSDSQVGISAAHIVDSQSADDGVSSTVDVTPAS
jgi:hypothetical protein